jgi:Rod binding domain-containing protein
MSIRPPSDIALDVTRSAASVTGQRAAVTRGTEGARRTAQTAQKKTYREFEAFVLQSFIQPMMPKNGSQVFGSGTAGEVWKSMLVEQMGREFAKNGGIGIASSLAGRDGTAGRRSDSTVYASLGTSPPAATGTTGASGRAAAFKWLPEDLATHWNERENAAGIPRNFIATNANIESGGRPGLRDPGNSNMGLHQFARSDMRELLGYAASPLDPRASTEALIVEARRNRTVLSRVFGRDPTGGELYVAHQQGTTGAKALFGAPNASAVDVLERVYGSRRTASKAIRLNIPSDSPLRRQDLDTITAKQFTDLWIGKFSRQAGENAPMIAEGAGPAGGRYGRVPAGDRPLDGAANRGAGDPAGIGGTSEWNRPTVDTVPQFLSSNISPHIQSHFLSRLAPTTPITALAADEPAGV